MAASREEIDTARTTRGCGRRSRRYFKANAGNGKSDVKISVGIADFTTLRPVDAQVIDQ